jgi:hypothetical protein
MYPSYFDSRERKPQVIWTVRAMLCVRSFLDFDARCIVQTAGCCALESVQEFETKKPGVGARGQEKKVLTTAWGAPIGDATHSLNIGGHVLASDVVLHEKMATFNRSKICERMCVVCSGSLPALRAACLQGACVRLGCVRRVHGDQGAFVSVCYRRSQRRRGSSMRRA